MARERYLIGVDTQKLQEERAPERPLTFREKVEKFWYNYQWAVIIGGVILALIIAGAVLVGSREKVDYTLVLVTKGKLAETALDELAEEMELYGKDLDGNGDVLRRLRRLRGAVIVTRLEFPGGGGHPPALQKPGLGIESRRRHRELRHRSGYRSRRNG